MSTAALPSATTSVEPPAPASSKATVSSPPIVSAAESADHAGDWIGLQIWLGCALLIVALHLYDFIVGLFSR